MTRGAVLSIPMGNKCVTLGAHKIAISLFFQGFDKWRPVTTSLRFTILGITVQSRLALVTGSVGTLCLMLDLQSQLMQLRTLQTGGSKVDASFPWFAFYRNPLSTSLVYISITAAPIVVVGLLLVQALRWSDAASWVALCAFVGICISAISLARTLHAARLSERQ